MCRRVDLKTAIGSSQRRRAGRKPGATLPADLAPFTTAQRTMQNKNSYHSHTHRAINNDPRHESFSNSSRTRAGEFGGSIVYPPPNIISRHLKIWPRRLQCAPE
jgi:hypothetical protein